MIKNQRFLFNDDGTENDYSLIVNDFVASTVVIDYTKTDDAIYIASDLPFTSKYIDLSVVNTEVSAASVFIWYNSAWVAAVDVLDGTAKAGAPLGQSGLLQWQTNRNSGWDCEQDSEDVTGVDAVGIYDKYWLKITYSETLTTSTALRYVGYKFADDANLFPMYPTLNDSALMVAFKSGKTDWSTQEIQASEAIITQLQADNITYSPAQLMNVEKFRVACAHKTAQIVFGGMGEAYDNDRARAEGSYIAAMKMKNYDVDKSGDGTLDASEMTVSTSYMSR